MSASLRTPLTWLLRPLLGLLLALLSLQAAAQGQFKPVPPFEARVTDQVGMLTLEQRQRLEAALADYETRTGSQIAVLLVASTEPEAIEQYSIRVTDAWKLGRKGVDDGVLLLVARDNPSSLRRLRIEAGRGVQGVLTDAQSKRILQDVIAPHFRQNDWYAGLAAGVSAIATLLNQEKFPAANNPAQAEARTPVPAQAGQATPGGDGAGVVFGIVMLVVGFLILRSIFKPRSARLARPGPGVVKDGWVSDAAGFVLGGILNSALGGGDDDSSRSSGGGDSGGGFSGGGGGSFDGGGASGDW